MKNENFKINEKPCIYWYDSLSLAFRLFIVHLILFLAVIVVVGFVGMLAQWFLTWRIAFPCYAVRSWALGFAMASVVASAISLFGLISKEVNND